MSTKTIQGKLWSVAPQYWAQHFEPWFLPMYKTALQQLQLTENDLLLDAGCGAGLFSHLVKKTGAGVIGIDAAPGLLEIARQRNPDDTFLEEDLEALPFRDAHFDVVAGFNSFQYAGNFDQALQEATRVLKPGGRLVMGIWAKPELSDATMVLKSIGSLLPPPPAGTPGPFALSEDGVIENKFSAHGLKMIFSNTISCPFQYASLEDGIKSFMGTGPAAAALNANTREVVEKTVATALQQFKVPGDIYFLQNHFLLFIAEKK